MKKILTIISMVCLTAGIVFFLLSFFFPVPGSRFLAMGLVFISIGQLVRVYNFSHFGRDK
ncbi:MAG: hypothetical protein J6I96_00025 [Oscillospiraceae bacterium]|nr:hypothetical protein [Oscillospiraceae bacterium]